jgi:hypothetical protein
MAGEAAGTPSGEKNCYNGSWEGDWKRRGMLIKG